MGCVGSALIDRIFSEVDQAGHHFWGRFAGELAARVIEPRLPIRVAAPSFWEPEGLSSSRELRARQPAGPCMSRSGRRWRSTMLIARAYSPA